MKSVKNPVATIVMASGANIVVELMPHLAPNTVNSFIYLANLGVFNNYKIARVEPGFVVDISTNAFDRPECRYLIANEASLTPPGQRLPPDLGTMCMGGYENGIAGGEFFFPLAMHMRLDGNYPCFGRVLEGIEEIVRIGSGPVQEFAFSYIKPMHKPAEPQVIVSVSVETFGVEYPEPERLDASLPEHWLMEDYGRLI